MINSNILIQIFKYNENKHMENEFIRIYESSVNGLFEYETNESGKYEIIRLMEARGYININNKINNKINNISDINNITIKFFGSITPKGEAHYLIKSI